MTYHTHFTIYNEKKHGIDLRAMIVDREKITKRIEGLFHESVEVKLHFLKNNKELLVRVVEEIAGAFKSDRKLLVFGNGGSACDAQHFVGEFVNRFMHDRPPLPAIALTADMSILTSCANDYSYDEVFERQMRALGRAGDIAFGISTSGNSKNVVRALKRAKEMRLITIGMTGCDGGEVGKIVDHHIHVALGKTPRIQETHIVVCHLIAEMIDHLLYDLPFVEH